MRPITHAAHEKLVETEGWARRGTGRSKARTGDHLRYTLTLADGDTLFTRVPHGAGQIEDPNRVAAILRDQLRVSEKDFWACVEDGVRPPRPRPSHIAAPQRVVHDYKLAKNLVTRVGLTSEQLEHMSEDEAVRRWQEHLVSGAPEPED